MKNCNHTLGYITRNHYDSIETEFIYNDEPSLKTLNLLKLEQEIFKFCPECGESLSEVLENCIEAKIQSINKEKEEEANQRINKQKEFDKELSLYQKSSKLNNLPENGIFLIRLNSSDPFDKRDHMVRGTKKEVIVAFFTKKKLSISNIKTIYLLPSEDEIQKVLKENNWVKVGGDPRFNVFKKSIDKTDYSLDFSSGLIYVSQQYGKERTEYSQVSIDRISNCSFIDFKLDLKEIKLK